jgi:hypothetical protein
VSPNCIDVTAQTDLTAKICLLFADSAVLDGTAAIKWLSLANGIGNSETPQDCGALADGEREHVEEHALVGQ